MSVCFVRLSLCLNIFAFVSLDFIPLEPFCVRQGKAVSWMLEIDEGMMLGTSCGCLENPFYSDSGRAGYGYNRKKPEIKMTSSPEIKNGSRCLR